MSSSLEVSDAEAAAVAVAPRVTLESMTARIVRTRYINDGALTIAVVEVDNGFKIVGKSASASLKNFNAELGQKFAYEDCVRQMWALEGYLLCEKLSSGGKP